MVTAESLELSFEWIKRQALSSTYELVGMTVLYLVVITAGCAVMKIVFKGKPFNVTSFTIPHNLILCLYSIYGFAGFSLVLFENFPKLNGNYTKVFCDPDMILANGMEYWFYTFYISKFFEYLDTVFLVLKAKPVIPPGNSQYLLHLYHHAITATMAWLCLGTRMTVVFIGPLLNTFVHIWMYAYYFLAEMNKIDRTIGGKYITPIQIIQFIIALVAMSLEVILSYTSQGGCRSDVHLLYFEIANYLVFLFLFVKVYFNKKKERTQAGGDNKKEQ